MSLYNGLTDAEFEKLLSLVDLDTEDAMLTMRLTFAICKPAKAVLLGDDDGEILSNSSLSECVNGNKEAAKLLITGLERDHGVNRNFFLEKYLFENTDKREIELQKKMIPDLVKEIRAKTGLSQRKFAEKYDISIKSLEAWESGSKTISKYAYEYLKSCLAKKSPAIHKDYTLCLPMNIISEELAKYLNECSLIDFDDVDYDDVENYAVVAHIPGTPATSEQYIVTIEDGEVIRDDKVQRIWETFPAELQTCIKVAIEYNCNKICFHSGYNIYDHNSSLEEGIAYTISGEES